MLVTDFRSLLIEIFCCCRSEQSKEVKEGVDQSQTYFEKFEALLDDIDRSQNYFDLSNTIHISPLVEKVALI